MNKLNIFKKELKKEWYVQGFSAFPVFLNSAAHSGLAMKKELGFSYTEFIFNYKNGYGEMWYLISDFQRIWRIIKKKMRRNPKYLEQVKKRYEEIYRRNEKLFSRIDSRRLSEVSDESLLEMLKECSFSTTDGVGIAHILDPIGPEVEKEFKVALSKCISDKKELNNVYAILTTPKKPSFIADEERELRKIAKGSASKHKKKLERHAKKYFWIQNSFAGGKNLNLAFFEKRMRKLAKRKKIESINDQKKIVKRYNLNRRIVNMVDLINFSAIWQDQRKAKALKSVGYFSLVIDEVSRRIGIKKDVLNYLVFSDILNAESLEDIKKVKSELTSREKGLLVLMRHNKELNYYGDYYSRLIKYHKQLSGSKKSESDELHGSIASQGTAVGNVVICIGIHSFRKVKKGDIIVASMTRPEYMPALKKASAIITDEGGITSHAAIIARELGIPAVIGTKVATKVLYDGDLVEVRANHGVVKILKRK